VRICRSAGGRTYFAARGAEYHDNLPLLCDHHRKVFEAIKDKDAKRSRAEMETHLAWVERQWMRIINAIT
jgi:DNA-binding FadR family transcriptional regulator